MNKNVSRKFFARFFKRKIDPFYVLKTIKHQVGLISIIPNVNFVKFTFPDDTGFKIGCTLYDVRGGIHYCITREHKNKKILLQQNTHNNNL